MTTDAAGRQEPEIGFDDFTRVEMRIGRVVSAEPNAKAKIPAYVMRVDFGPALGVRTSSAQLTQNYEPRDLVGTLVVAVVNFAAKRVAGVKSEVLILAAVDEQRGTVLLRPERDVEPGTRVL